MKVFRVLFLLMVTGTIQLMATSTTLPYEARVTELRNSFSGNVALTIAILFLVASLFEVVRHRELTSAAVWLGVCALCLPVIGLAVPWLQSSMGFTGALV